MLLRHGISGLAYVQPSAPPTSITVVETHTASQQSHTTPLDITLGTLAENDRVLVIRASDQQTPVLNAISGYTSIYNAQLGAIALGIEEKKMGSTPDTVVTIPVRRLSGSVYDEAVAVYVLRVVDTTDFLDVAIVTSAAGNSSSYSPPAITTFTDGAMVIAGIVKDDTNTSTDGTLAAGYENKIFVVANNAGNANANLLVGTKIVETADLETPGAFTINGADEQMQGFTIAVRPA